MKSWSTPKHDRCWHCGTFDVESPNDIDVPGYVRPFHAHPDRPEGHAHPGGDKPHRHD